jgi:hypothetical protein
MSLDLDGLELTGAALSQMHEGRIPATEHTPDGPADEYNTYFWSSQGRGRSVRIQNVMEENDAKGGGWSGTCAAANWTPDTVSSAAHKQSQG